MGHSFHGYVSHNQRVAKLVNITPITMVYGTYNELVTGANLNQQTSQRGAPQLYIHISNYIYPYIQHWIYNYISSKPHGYMYIDYGLDDIHISNFSQASGDPRRFPRRYGRTSIDRYGFEGDRGQRLLAAAL